MMVFGIDTCCGVATAALMNEEKLLSQTVTNRDKTHSETMMPQIAFMMESVGVDISQVDVFAAAVGPGSFTGVRIGVATAKALAQGVNKPCAAISTLEALAFNNSTFDGLICPILDARRNQVYQAYFQGGENFARLSEDSAVALSDLIAQLQEKDEKVLFCGDGVLAFQEEIKEHLPKAQFAPRMQNLNLAAAVAELALLHPDRQIPYGELVPQYVRLSQAERERLEKENKKGEQA